MLKSDCQFLGDNRYNVLICMSCVWFGGGGGMSLCHTSACIGCEMCSGSCRTKPAEANTHDYKLELGLIAEYPNKFVYKRWHANPTFCSPYIMTTLLLLRVYIIAVHAWSSYAYVIVWNATSIPHVRELASVRLQPSCCHWQRRQENWPRLRAIIGNVASVDKKLWPSRYRWQRRQVNCDLRAIVGNIGSVGK